MNVLLEMCIEKNDGGQQRQVFTYTMQWVWVAAQQKGREQKRSLTAEAP